MEEERSWISFLLRSPQPLSPFPSHHKTLELLLSLSPMTKTLESSLDLLPTTGMMPAVEPSRLALDVLLEKLIVDGVTTLIQPSLLVSHSEETPLALDLPRTSILDVVLNALYWEDVMEVVNANVMTPANVMINTGERTVNASNALKETMEPSALETENAIARLELVFANLDGEERTVDAELVKETHLALDTEPVTVMELVLATKDGLTLVFKRSVIVPPLALTTAPNKESANVDHANVTQDLIFFLIAPAKIVIKSVDLTKSVTVKENVNVTLDSKELIALNKLTVENSRTAQTVPRMKTVDGVMK